MVKLKLRPQVCFLKSGSHHPPVLILAAGIENTSPASKSKLTKDQARLAKESSKDVTENDEEDDSGEDDSDDGGEYCLCRGPDDHRMMVFCEGGCDDWYHCSCVAIDVIDAEQLLDRFVCPKCRSETQRTTFRRICRLFNFGPHLCRKAAIVPTDSKLLCYKMYCSEEHLNEWVALFLKSTLGKNLSPDETLGIGHLEENEVANILESCENFTDLQGMGEQPRLPRGGDDPGKNSHIWIIAETATNYYKPIPAFSTLPLERKWP